MTLKGPMTFGETLNSAFERCLRPCPKTATEAKCEDAFASFAYQASSTNEAFFCMLSGLEAFGALGWGVSYNWGETTREPQNAVKVLHCLWS